ncbi:hypothetical protein TPA0907_15890 [Micromonospora humidisoli]|uniref:hypothetical protein n=1 Tax=Micromonospora sp. AKA109 TaxID=2733865 RepID=UPI0022C9307F|nr:hypothetical protein [Micromonospora sp. AKA109]GHJ07222.1 hypothetical protein TPA0907_15890 [Micromonospora sp. AKA109]
MTTTTGPTTDRRTAVHRLLLRLAGQAPDEVVSAARQWLAAGQLAEVAQAVAFTCLTGGVGLTASERVLLTGILHDTGADGDVLAGLVTGEAPPVAYGMAPVGPQVLAGADGRMPYSMDLTVGGDGPGGPDDLDRAAVAAVTAAPGPVGLWRSWRYPAVAARYPQPKRLYLVQGPEPVALAARIATTLETAGERHPLVEVFGEPTDLPEYQRRALAYSALLWADRPATPLRLATPPDPAAPPGTLTDDEAERVVAYLGAGVPLLASPHRSADGFDPASAADPVPTGVRGDGRWLWSEAVTYYADQYGFAPEPDLLAAIRAADYTAPTLDAVAVHRSLSYLFAAMCDPDRTGVNQHAEPAVVEA